MRDFLRKLVRLVVISMLVYTVMVTLIAVLSLEDRVHNVINLTGTNGHSLLRLREAEQASEPVDMLIFGSSHAYRGFDPRIFDEFGISTFNLGSSGQSPLHSYLLAKRYLDRFSPQVVVIEVYWVAMELEVGAETAIDLACNAPVASDFVHMSLETKSILAVNSLLVGYIKRLWRPIDSATQKDIPFEIYTGRGYVETTRWLGPELDLNSLPPHHSKVPRKQLHRLEQFVRFCQSRGSRVIVVRTPVTREHFQSLHNYAEITAPLLDLADKHKFQFWDFNADSGIGYTRSDFLDKNHLSQAGAEKFDRAFVERLLRCGQLEGL